jgi:S1-C subfamily serine protease
MTGSLQSLSDNLADLVEQVSPGLVRVEARRRLPASGVVWSREGLIVTAHHVVQRDTGIRVGLAGGAELEAEVVGRDPATDLAVLKVGSEDLPTPVWQSTDSLKVGHIVLALGRPHQQTQATLGVVSALSGGWRTPVGGDVSRYLQTDVVMYPGFSGGPLIGSGGAVWGINSSALLRGVSLTLPTETVERVVKDLVEHGRIRRGFLGVSAQPVELPQAAAEELNQATGLLLVSVEADSPAERAGLTLGDTLVTFADSPISKLEDLLAQLSGDRVGSQVSLRLLRGGEVIEKTAEIGERS